MYAYVKWMIYNTLMDLNSAFHGSSFKPLYLFNCAVFWRSRFAPQGVARAELELLGRRRGAAEYSVESTYLSRIRS